ncbi:MAG: DNA methyltransferase [Candidatus Methanosuratincola sp.]
MKVRIDDIKVGERIRRKVENIDKLAESIREFGLIEPIVVDRDLRLVAGERRLRACQLLDMTEIDAVFVDELDDWKRMAIELEENIQRENLTYAEEVEAKLRLHELYVAKYGKTRGSINLPTGRIKGWGVDETAELLGESVGEVAQDLQLARAIRERPELAEKGTKSAAFKAMKAMEELEVRKRIAEVLAEDAKKTKGEAETRVLLGDARVVLKEFEDESFDFCVTDPPYGVGFDESSDFTQRWDVRIGDKRDDFSVQREVFREVYRVLREGAHCYVMFASMKWGETLEMLREVGFRVSPIPLIWVKSPVGKYDPYHSFASSYEPIFYCSKDKPRAFTSPSPSDVLTFKQPSSKRHPTEKPVELFKHLISLCSVEGEIGIDPFVGSGTFLVACKELRRRGVGIEKDEEYYTVAWERVEGDNDGKRDSKEESEVDNNTQTK